jgi:hypothetical protein
MIPCVRIIYFAGWEQEGGVPTLFPGDNTEKMIGRILTNYKYLNDQPGVHNIIAPIGVAWLSAMAQRPELARKPYHNESLYAADGRHPGWTGSYLAACVLFATIFHQSPLYLQNRSTFAKQESDTFVKKIAWKTISDNYEITNISSVTPEISTDANPVSTPDIYAKYQWFKDSAPIAGANNFKYLITDEQASYWVETIDSKGCVHWSFPVNLPQTMIREKQEIEQDGH